MLAVRVHLDDCGPENGPLRVIPGSHLSGRLDTEQIEAWRRSTPEVECLSPRGGLIALRPLLLHASSPARQPGHRRVLHLEFAGTELPPPLLWHRRRTGI
jgi:ectoine hydroxylase-related dioxygenase (phytanoyl-CoA dioxygenase family)